jgi:hypothetical protein
MRYTSPVACELPFANVWLKIAIACYGRRVRGVCLAARVRRPAVADLGRRVGIAGSVSASLGARLLLLELAGSTTIIGDLWLRSFPIGLFAE